MRTGVALLAAGMVLGLGAAAWIASTARDEPTATAPTRAPDTPSRTVVDTTSPLYVIPADDAPAGAAGSAYTTDGGLNPLGGNDPEDRTMPDVVCLTLQDAQDEIQDHGVFFSRSEDATGQGRRQILDRNWIVVAQRPAGGEPIGEGDAVLSVVKKGEPNDCP